MLIRADNRILPARSMVERPPAIKSANMQKVPTKGGLFFNIQNRADILESTNKSGLRTFRYVVLSPSRPDIHN